MTDFRRPLKDLDKVCDEIRAKLKVKVTLIDWATLSIGDQLRLIGSATVHITGPGGGSFIAVYLPRGPSIFLSFLSPLSCFRFFLFELRTQPLDGRSGRLFFFFLVSLLGDVCA